MAFEFPGNPGQIRGSLIGMKIGGKPVACETSCDFNFSVEMLPAAGSAGRWAYNIVGERSWTMSVDGNLLLQSLTDKADFKTVLNAVLTGEELEVEFGTRNVSPYFIITGKAYPNAGSLTAAGNSLAVWNISFTGNGPFVPSSEEFYLIINAMPPEADYPLIINSGANQ